MTTIKKFVLITLIVSISTVKIFAQRDNHVIMVIIDGARYSETLGDPLVRYVPHMYQLSQQGVVVDTMLNDNITLTKRAIPAIWCGSWSTPKDTVVNGVANQYATVPTLWEYFRKNRGVDSTHAMYIMKMLTTPWIQSFYYDYGQKYWPWYVLQGTTDLDVWQNAKSKLQMYHPELTVIYLPDVDSSPASGWSAYTQSIMIADSIVGMIWDFVQSDPVYQNTTTLLVTNDHGRHLDNIQDGFKSHGDNCFGCQHVMFLGVGLGMPKGVHTSTRRSIIDITPTIGSLLNFPTPYATGKTIMEIMTSVDSEILDKVPSNMIHLEQNYPNPFNPNTIIRFSLPKTTYVTLKIYDAVGRKVSQLLSQEMNAGSYQTEWNAAGCASGVYYYRITVGDYAETKKFLLLK
ncbi:MAG: T9SS type A sorting domain-containing protein [Ignavibacteriales bacterium]|nr:T9SS type A sorting domain-containing protein [Ignavibacteriales bacterium]